MIDDPGFMPHGNGDRPFRVGCAVELTCGVLGGMRGVLAGFSRGRSCLIHLDGVQAGVLVRIDATSLRERPAEPTVDGVLPVTVAALQLRRPDFDPTGV